MNEILNKERTILNVNTYIYRVSHNPWPTSPFDLYEQTAAPPRAKEGKEQVLRLPIGSKDWTVRSF